MTNEINAEVLPAQDDFIFAEQPVGSNKVFEALYSGAVGSGKSRSLCIRLVKRALYPGAFEGLTRKTLVELKQTTLRTLLEPDNELPPVLPMGTYTHHKSERVISLNGGGKIHYFGCDDPETMKSLNLSGCAIDEVTELDEAEYNMLVTRVRNTACGSLELYMATNPGPKSHFLYERFCIGDPTKRPPERFIIHSASHDNFFLSPAYLSTLDGFTGAFHDRYVRGIWGNFEGMVYTGFDPEVHIVRYAELPHGTVYSAIDDGFTDPFVVLVAIQDSTQHLHVIDEVYHSNLLQQDKIGIMRDVVATYDLNTVWVPHDAADLLKALQQEGIPARPADNKPGSVVSGIGRVQRTMAIDRRTGRPRLTISDKCSNLIREIEGYAWNTATVIEQPKKKDDHTCDALRYLAVGVEGRVEVDIFRPGEGDEHVELVAHDTPNIQDELRERMIDSEENGGWQ